MPRGDKKTARKSSTTRATARSSSGTVTAVVLLDTYRWHDECNDPTTPVNEADKGEKITVSADEFKRSQKMTPPGLAKIGSDKAKVAEDGGDTSDEPPLTKPDGSPVEPDDSE